MDLKSSSIENCKIIDLPKIHNRAGNITTIHSGVDIPFDIKRVYYLYDIPGGESRGGHAHKELFQLIVSASGSFDVIIEDGKNKKTVTLNRPYSGLIIVPGIWRELTNFSSGSVCLVLASEVYDENDYIRDYKEFIKFKKNDPFIIRC